MRSLKIFGIVYGIIAFLFIASLVAFLLLYGFEPTDNIVPEETQKNQVITIRDDDIKTYILNVSTKKFHYTSCPTIKLMNEENKKMFRGDRSEVIAEGYTPCGRCEP